MKKMKMKCYCWASLLAGLMSFLPMMVSAQTQTSLVPPLRYQEESSFKVVITLDLQRLIISGDTTDQILSRLETFLTGESQNRSFVMEAAQYESDSELGGKQENPSRLLTPEELNRVLIHGLRVLSDDPAVQIQETSDTFIPLTQWIDQWESADEEKPWEAPGSWEVTLVNVERRDELTFQRQITVGDPNCLRQMVNREWALQEDYVPADLLIPQVTRVFAGESESSYMRLEAAQAVERLFEAALEETGVTLYARSGYRSYATQRSLFNARARARGFERANLTTALPGQSEHQTGLAMDISSRTVGLQLSASFGKTPEGQWVAENAHRFGYIIRYPEEKTGITGYVYEPWHLRYVGIPLAEALYQSRLTMEEFADAGNLVLPVDKPVQEPID